MATVVLVFGARGWIGAQMSTLMTGRGWRVVAAKSRMENYAEVRQELDDVRPDVVVVAAGLTGRPNIDSLESCKPETSLVNVAGTVLLASECSRRGIYVTTFATGCIYEYDATHPVGGRGFTEDDAPNFTGSYYSRTKIAAELATRELPGHLLLRVRMPISSDGSPRCFVTKIARYARVVDVPNSVTVLADLLPVALELIAARTTGVFNFVNPGPVSHAEILDAYKAIVDPGFTYSVMDMATHDTVVVARRSNNCLESAKLQAAAAAAGVHIPTALDSVKRLFAANQPKLRYQHLPRRVLVTGGAGFVGSGLVHRLQDQPSVEVVVVLDVLDTCASLKNIEGLNKVRVVIGDICDIDVVAILEAHRIDTVFHLAAQTHVDNSFENSKTFTRVNVLGTHALLQATTAYGKLAVFLHVSTDEVYGETQNSESSMKESRVLMPTNPYAASKAGAEALVHAYIKSYGVNAIVVRCNNIYGPRQYPEKVVPRFCVRALSHLPIQIQGSGDQTRHFVHVDDAADAIFYAASRGVRGDIFNIGSNTEKSILQLAHAVVDALASTSTITYVKDRPFNDVRYWVDDTLLRTLGWAPKIPFDRGLADTIQWYKDRLAVLGDIWPTFNTAVTALG